MIINPYKHKDTCNELERKGQEFISYDNTNNIYRVDSVYRAPSKSKYSESGESIFRTTHFGLPFVDGSMAVNDFIGAEIDAKTGNILEFDSSIIGSSYLLDNPRAEKPENYINPSYIDEDVITIMKSPLYNVNNKQIYSYVNMRKNYNASLTIDTYEDALNIPFGDTVGIIAAYLLKSSTMLPYRACFIIDSKYGLNIKELDIPEYDITLKNTFNKTFLEFVKKLKLLVDAFIAECAHYDDAKDIMILAYVSDFGLKMRVINKEFNTQYLLDLNLSDHCRYVKMMDASFYNGAYIDSEYFGIIGEKESINYSLFKNVVFTPDSVTSYNLSDLKNGFLYGHSQDNFMTSFNIGG